MRELIINLTTTRTIGMRRRDFMTFPSGTTAAKSPAVSQQQQVQPDKDKKE
jgi:hypothetical protein